MKFKALNKASIISATFVGCMTTPVISTADETLEEVVVVGSRGAPRSVTESPVPVDVIGAEELSSSGSNDLLMQLQAAVPSLNVHLQPISDAASMIRPANLRGLSSDSTLIMVNGKRRHRASVIAFQGGGINDGSQGADISVIPSVALKNVEVLRDGAAAQYGSDAIAGVINFVLKDSAEGRSFFVKQGEYSEGDGATTTIGGNMGLPMTDDGFMNLSFQLRNADPTSRSVQRPDAAKLIADGNTNVADPAQIWGAPIVKDDLTLFFNSGLDLGNGSEAYMFGNYSERDVDGGFYYRNPNNRGGVFTYNWNNNTAGRTDANGNPVDENGLTKEKYLETWSQDGENVNEDKIAVNSQGKTKEQFAEDFVQKGTEDDGKYRLVADLGGCSDDVSSTIDDIRKVDPDNKDDLQTLINSDKCYVHNQQAPGGYTPRFGSNITDTSLTAGVRGEFDSGFLQGYHYDFSGSVGRSQSDFGLKNTFNPSMGPDSKRDFSTGSYIQLEKTFNFDLHKQFGNTSFATGYEWRETSFQVISGEPASWQQGKYTYIKTNPAENTDGDAIDKYGLTKADAENADEYKVKGADPWEQAKHIEHSSYQPFSVGSHGFAGFSGDSAGTFTRRNYALYMDVESQLSDRLLLGGAVRYEDYSSFGDTTNYKMTFNYQVQDGFALRGSHSTGFRAPTQGQANVVNTQTTFDNNGELIQAQTLPGYKLGHGQLQPETSKNFALGTVLTMGEVDLTIDWFNIEVQDRIALTSSKKPTDDEIAKMGAAGVPSPELMDKVNYFTNDFDTKTRGLDIVATYGTELLGGNTDFSLAYNYTKTRVSNQGGATSDFKVKRLEQSLPNHRATFTMNQNWGHISALARANFYGSYYAVHADSEGLSTNAGSAVTIDLETTYAINDNFDLSVGGQNIFNKKAEPLNNNVLGGIYYETSPFGFEGAFWYLKAGYNF